MNPGAEEKRAGRPFMGPSGALLRAWLRDAGLLERTGFANVELHPTPGNREPNKREFAGCLRILLMAIDNMRPSVLLRVGAVPARSVGGFNGAMGSMVGRFRQKNGTLHTVIYHPAYLLRMRGGPRYAEVEGRNKDVLKEAVARLDGQRELPEYRWVPYLGAAFNQPEVLRRPFWADLPVACDIESEGMGKEPDPRLDQVESIAVYGGAPLRVEVYDHPPPLHLAQSVAFHNSQYDLVLLARQGINPFSLQGIDDTMVMAWTLGETPLGPKPLARRLLGVNVIEYAKARDTDLWPQYVAQDPPC